MYRKHGKTIKIVNELKVLWRLVAVGNGVLWLTQKTQHKTTS